MLASQPAAWSDLDPLIGRDGELAALLGEIERSRLVSLTGPGGSGKTRLAEAVISTARQEGREATFVDLSSVDAVAFVAPAIASALRLEGSAARDPIDIVVDALSDREALLGLDNLEQIPGVGEIAASLLTNAPGLRILTTSRIPLGVRGEVEIAVPTLALPAEPTAGSVEDSAAGSLFLARARALGRLRSVDAVTAADIWTLLHRLDGLPLAIELAAARTRAMTPAEILAWLDRRGPEAIDAVPGDRHQSLRAILDWTLGLLSPAELTTLEAVSVCAGFDFELAQVLAPDVDVFAAIDSLIALGLVTRVGVAGGVSRFKLLETIRTTVLRGMSAERRSELEDGHAQRFLELAKVWDEETAGGWTPETLERLDGEADNIRRALDRFDQIDPRRGLLLGSLLTVFWQTRGRLGEGLRRFERTSALAPESSVELARASARQLAIVSDAVLGPAALKDMTERTIGMARASADPSAIVTAVSAAMWTAPYDEDRDAARAAALAAEADVAGLDLSRLETRARIALVELRVFIAGAKHGVTSDEYVASLRGQVAEAKAAGWPGEQAIASCNLAQVLSIRGENREAAALATDAVRLFRALDRTADLGWALSYLAAALAETGRASEAIDAAIESAAITGSMPLPMAIVDSLRTSMPVALAAGQPALAARLWGAVCGIRDRGEYSLPPIEAQVAERWLARASTLATPVAIEVARLDGLATDPTELLRDLPTLLRVGGATASRTRLRHGELTTRELEILKLVGLGRTDPEIAEALFISPKTASVHVSNVKGKLGLQSRLEIALKARELGLLDGVTTD